MPEMSAETSMQSRGDKRVALAVSRTTLPGSLWRRFGPSEFVDFLRILTLSPSEVEVSVSVPSRSCGLILLLILLAPATGDTLSLRLVLPRRRLPLDVPGAWDIQASQQMSETAQRDVARSVGIRYTHPIWDASLGFG